MIISPYVYGINALDGNGNGSGFTQQKTKWGLVRNGGNTTTAWNWTTNYRNMGNLACFAQGTAGGGTALAGAVTAAVDSIAAVQSDGAAFLATVPIVDHVAAAVVNDTSATCPASSSCSGTAASSTQVNSNNLDFASTDPASTAFVANAPKKGGAYCTCAPGQRLRGGCVGIDEPGLPGRIRELHEGDLRRRRDAGLLQPRQRAQLLAGTHPEVWPYTGTVPARQSLVTFDDIVSRTRRYARRDQGGVADDARCSAPSSPKTASSTRTATRANRTTPDRVPRLLPRPDGRGVGRRGHAAPRRARRALLHAGSSDPAQCVQNPRMFWDPGFTRSRRRRPTASTSAGRARTTTSTPTAIRAQMIPRLLGKIATAYRVGRPRRASRSANTTAAARRRSRAASPRPTTRHLRARGRLRGDGVAARRRPTNNYLVAAFDLYRNYDGNGADRRRHGRRRDDDRRGALVGLRLRALDRRVDVDVVAINKTTAPSSVTYRHRPCPGAHDSHRVPARRRSRERRCGDRTAPRPCRARRARAPFSTSCRR